MPQRVQTFFCLGCFVQGRTVADLTLGVENPCSIHPQCQLGHFAARAQGRELESQLWQSHSEVWGVQEHSGTLLCVQMLKEIQAV